jgi:hypothetical protein
MGNWKRAMEKVSLRLINEVMHDLRRTIKEITTKAYTAPQAMVHYSHRQAVPTPLTSSQQLSLRDTHRTPPLTLEADEEISENESITSDAETDDDVDSEDDSVQDSEEECSDEEEDQEDQKLCLKPLIADKSLAEASQLPSPPQTPTRSRALDLESVGISNSPPPSAIKIILSAEISYIPIGPCKLAHAARRPLMEDCLVCKDPCGEDIETLVWCKSTCGHNLHLSCFEEWRPWAEKSRGGLRCPLWYVRAIMKLYEAILIYQLQPWSLGPSLRSRSRTASFC